MAAKLNTVGAVTLKNVRKEGGAEAVDLAASVALKKTLGDTAVTLRLTEATLADMKSFNGAMLTLTKALGSGFSATAKYDLASKGVLASLTQLRKLDGGRLLEASAVWSSRSRQWLLEAAGRPHGAHKVSATCNPHTGAVWGSYAGELAGFTVTPSYNLAKRAGSLAVARKLRGGQTLRGVYTPADRLAVLELANKPFKVGVKARHSESGWGPPTIGVSVEREVTLGGGGRSGDGGGGGKGAAGRAPAGQAAAPGAGGGAQRPGPRLGAAARDPTLDDKLAALDAAIAARFEAKGANPRRLADGVDVVSFQGGDKKG